MRFFISTAIFCLACAPLTAAADSPAPHGAESVLRAFTTLDERAPWRSWPEREFPRHPAERFLKDWVIALDPGHGGDGHLPGYKRGPTGVREADINWRVALHLERLLMEAGVHVVMTRSGDHEVSLRQRAEIANHVLRPDGGRGADLFISLHHNASSNPETNYTSVWFHGETDWSEPDLDFARKAAHALFRELRTDAGLTSFLMSDQQMFPRGFGVLNSTRVPAVLLESSFHSNPEEEQRLRDPLYNLREAYAIYTALCEYAYGGRPTQTLSVAEDEDGALVFTAEIDDGMPSNWWGANRNRTVSSTVQFFLDDEPLPTRFDPDTGIARAVAREVKETGGAETFPERVLRIHHANFAKNHNWPQRHRLTVNLDSEEERFQISPMGARRTRPDPDPGEAYFAEEDLPRPTPLELPAGPQPATDAAAALAAAKPGDLVKLPGLPADAVPILPARLTALESPELLFSDMPEYFRTGDGIAMRETVPPGEYRLYTYHVPDPEADRKTITAVLENMGGEPLHLRFKRGSFPRPEGHYHRVGKTALMEFFSHRPGPEDRVVEPGEAVPIDPAMDAAVLRKDQLAHGFYEFSIDQPARVTVLQRDPEMDNAEALATLPELPRVLPGTHPSGAGRGRFPISDFLVTLPGPLALDTAGGVRQLVVADGRRDPWIKGRDGLTGEDVENKGNYGVVYRIRVPLTHSDGRSWAVLMHNLYHGSDFCRHQASAVKVGEGGFPAEVVPVPRESVTFSGEGNHVLLQVYPPSDDNGPLIAEIEFSPPGASCLPTPIFFVPFEP